MSADRSTPFPSVERSPEQRSANIVEWAEDTARHAIADPLTAAAVAPPTVLPLRPSATVTRQDAIRGTSVTLSIPLDEPAGARAVRPSDPVNGDGARSGASLRALPPKKKVLRRDSLERREALLKGKEGSRRRQRWENGHLLGNPWAEPPLPSDWEVRPTHPRTVVPYFLAPLWEADADKRARRQSKVAKAKARATVESRATVLPRELREKLKRTKSARGLLMHLENEVRRFLEDYHRRQSALEQAGLDSVLETDEEDGIAMEASSDEEIVFVGREGQMRDVPPSPKAKKGRRRGRSPGDAAAAAAPASRPGTSGTAMTGISSDEDMVEIEAGGEMLTQQLEKLIFNAPVDEQGAGFARWIVHSIADYYGLKTWSVTVGDPARREAYVGIDSMRTGRGAHLTAARSLPQPLWGMV